MATIKDIVARMKTRSEPIAARPNRQKKHEITDCECGHHCFTKTSQWLTVLVSPEDRRWLEDYAWSAQGNYVNQPFYAQSSRYYRDTGKSRLLHQVITGHKIKMIDHKDGNGHNCTRGNIKETTYHENNSNTVKQRRKNRGNMDFGADANAPSRGFNADCNRAYRGPMPPSGRGLGASASNIECMAQ